MAISVNDIPRAQKRDVARSLHLNLVTRAAAGPAEPTLDEYIPELDDLAQALSAPITGNIVSDAVRTSRLVKLEEIDCGLGGALSRVQRRGSLGDARRRRSGPRGRGGYSHRPVR